MKKAIVLGAGGFIGHHLVTRLKSEGYYVKAADLKYPEFESTKADEFVIADLRVYDNVLSVINDAYDEVYQLAADMGGASYIFTGLHDADVMHNSASINLNVAETCKIKKVKKVFFSSSACVYPEYNQMDPNNPKCSEESAIPADPDSCLHPDTEVLTKEGFKSIVDLSMNDLVATLNYKGNLEYHRPINKQIKHYSGKLIDIETKYISCSITPDHNIVECDNGGNNIKNTKAEEFVGRNRITKGYFKRNCNWIGSPFKGNVEIQSLKYSRNRIKNGYEFILDDYLELIAWFVTEGSSGFYKNKDYVVQIRQTKQLNLKKIIDLCKRMGLNPYVPKDNGRIILYSKVLWNHFESFGKGANNKFLPNWVLDLPKEKLKILYDIMMLGDGSVGGGKSCYTTTSKILRDQFIEICLKIGYATSVYTIESAGNYKTIYHVNISKQHLIHKVTSDNISYCEYQGNVYDITIPNHIFYIRYNGKHMWTGNCYGWEKLFSEKLFLAYMRNYELDVKIARFHNIFGECSTWDGGKEKSPAAICRKVIQCPSYGEIEIFGDGKQTRSFLYIDECVEGIRRLMNSPYHGPINIGSEEMISINDFANMIIDISGKKINIKNIPGPLGVRGRNSDNRMIFDQLHWKPEMKLIDGMEKLYEWIEKQVDTNNSIMHASKNNIFKEIIKEGDFCYDIGANEGYKTSNMFSVGASKILCIEPQTDCCKKLNRKFKNKNVVLLQTAISNYEGISQIRIAGGMSTLSPEYIEATQKQRFPKTVWHEPVSVPVTTMDNVINKYGMPDFCKIDVEGHELEILQGLNSPIKTISIEFTPELKDKTFGCIKELMRIGEYKFNYSEKENDTFTFKEWINSDDMISFLSKNNDFRISYGDVYAKLWQ